MRRRSMITEIDLLKQDIPRLEKKFGADNPFVEVLKAQLAALQNKAEQLTKRDKFHQGVVKFKRSQILKRNERSDTPP